jgi:hypothetical protein
MDTMIENFKSIEQINTLNYNYGQILNQNNADLSSDNRLAVSTNKCLFVFNLNLSRKTWTSSSCATANSTSKALSDFNNDFYDLSIIETPKICLQYDKLIKKYFNFNSKQKLKKRKPAKNVASQAYNDIDDNESNNDENDPNDDIYLKKNMFDSEFIKILTSFNHSFIAQHPTDTASSLAGFKTCKWNKTTERNLLATITQNYQVVLYFFNNDAGKWHASALNCARD